ncbi:hypothetical protein DVH24_033214 [Malus domestica]|uniref:Uncharacterized protein n=1 Tax=Malus domestica TaxID=3750 RepID=A0A498J9E4_MALDO|nr:hypothetical protein DVH24_033214 [Malus domestica]
MSIDCTLSHLGPGPPPHPGLDSTVTRYCPLWAPTTPSRTSHDPPHPGLDSTVTRYCPLWAPTTPSRFCFWELTRELPSGSPIMGVLSCATRLTSKFR